LRENKRTQLYVYGHIYISAQEKRECGGCDMMTSQLLMPRSAMNSRLESDLYTCDISLKNRGKKSCVYT
jgi:hypothetical protein